MHQRRRLASLPCLQKKMRWEILLSRENLIIIDFPTHWRLDAQILQGIWRDFARRPLAASVVTLTCAMTAA